MNIADRFNNLEEEKFFAHCNAEVIHDNEFRTARRIEMQNREFTVSVVKWKDTSLSAAPGLPYEIALRSKDDEELLPLYGTGDEVLALNDLDELEIILNNLQEGKSIKDKSWLEGIDRLYEKADETEKKNRSEYEEISSDNTRKKIEDRKRNVLKSRQLRRKLHKRRSGEKVPNVVLTRRDSEKNISDTEKRTITSEVKIKIYRGKARE